jgi:hypothetical protein
MRRAMKFPHVFRTKTVPPSRMRCDEAMTAKIRSTIDPGALRPGEDATHTLVIVNRWPRAVEVRIATSCSGGLIDYHGQVPWDGRPLIVSTRRPKAPSALIELPSDTPRERLPTTAYVDVELHMRFCDPSSRVEGPWRFSHELQLESE